MTKEETDQIIKDFAEQGVVVTTEQIELAVSQLAEIMFMAEEEFNIRIVPDGDPRLKEGWAKIRRD